VPVFPENLQALSHDHLRKLAGQCGLQNSRARKFLLQDLSLIRNGEKEKVPLGNWKMCNLIPQPPITTGLYICLVCNNLLVLCIHRLVKANNKLPECSRDCPESCTRVYTKRICACS
jgi:hypothetical protein